MECRLAKEYSRSRWLIFDGATLVFLAAETELSGDESLRTSFRSRHLSSTDLNAILMLPVLKMYTTGFRAQPRKAKNRVGGVALCRLSVVIDSGHWPNLHSSLTCSRIKNGNQQIR